MVKTKIGFVEAIMLILTVVVSHSFLSLPNEILTKYSSASLLNIIYIGIISLLLVNFIVWLFKNFPGMDVLDISEKIGGKYFKNFIGFLFILYFCISSGFMLRNFCESIKIIYYPLTHINFLSAFFIIAIYMANNFDFVGTIKTNKIILPFALTSIIIIFITTIPKFVPQRIFPILGNGFYQTFVIGLSNIASFGGIVYLYFLPPLLKNPAKYKKVSIISIIITTFYLIFTVTILLFVFSFFIKIHEISPIYNATRYIEFGSFFQRFESIFLLIWIIVFCCYISIALKFITHIFQKITLLNDAKPLIPILGLLIYGITLIPKNLATSQICENIIYPYLMICLVIIICPTILIFANIKERKRQ